jgi:DNA replication licensing factor MCM3
VETLIRLSTAHAKARLSKNVTAEDAQAAIELVQYAYFKRVLEKEKEKKRRRRNSGASTDEEDEVKSKKSKRTRKRNPPPGEPGHDPYIYEEDEEDDDDSHIDEAIQRVSRSQTKAAEASRDQSQSSVPQVQQISNDRYISY